MLVRLIFALGILHVGETSSRSLANHFQSLSELMDATPEELQRIPDVGEVVGTSIHQFFHEPRNRELIARLEKAGVRPKIEPRIIASDSPFTETTWVITGTLSQPRDEIAEMITSRGGKVSGSVSKRTDYVPAAEEAGSKLDKARKVGVKIIDEQEFLKLCGE